MRNLFNPNRFTPDEKPEKVIKGKTPAKVVKKVTGEGVLFKAIWNTRPRKSFISGENLGSDGYPWMFAHVLPKKKYPEFRLLAENIVLLTQEEHFLFDNGVRSTLTGKGWQKLFDLEHKLKELYKFKHPTP